MSEPGWYPDPGGNPGHFRYWDGRSWSPQSTPTPMPPASGPRGPSRGLVLVAIALTIALIVTAVIWRTGLAGRQNPTPTPTTSTSSSASASAEPSAGPETGATTAESCPPPTEDPGGGELIGSRMHSGGISVPTIAGWAEPSDDFLLDGLTEPITQTKAITGEWQSVVLIGAIARNRFPEAKQAAVRFTDCFTAPVYYRGITKVTTLVDEQVTVDGRPAHHIRSEVRVSGLGPNIPGDIVDVVVIDTPDTETMAVFMATATIDDADTQAEVDAVMADIRIET